MATVWPTRSLFLRPRWGRWYGMVNVDLYSAIITKVFNALNTLVSREKPGFQTLSKGLVVLLCAEVVRQRVPDHGGGVVRWTYVCLSLYKNTIIVLLICLRASYREGRLHSPSVRTCVRRCSDAGIFCPACPAFYRVRQKSGATGLTTIILPNLNRRLKQVFHWKIPW